MVVRFVGNLLAWTHGLISGRGGVLEAIASNLRLNLPSLGATAGNDDAVCQVVVNKGLSSSV